MKETVRSDTTQREYCPSDAIRILNTKQFGFYLRSGLTLLDVYPSQDFKTGDDVVVYVFDKKESQAAYRKWMGYDD